MNLSGKRGNGEIRRTNKYHSKKTTVDGIRFDSKKEAKRYQDLKMLEDLGIISSLRLQVPFELIPSQFETVTDAKGRKKKRCVERSVKYKADFVYIDSDGNQVVEDTKSQKTKTKDYIIKRKLMLQVYGIKIKEV